jgi:hypothetical protein
MAQAKRSTIVDQCIAPVWGAPVKLIKSTDLVKGTWAMGFLKDIKCSLESSAALVIPACFLRESSGQSI